MLWEVWRYFDHGWIKRYWIDPTFHFAYYGFEWVKPWPGDGMYLHMLALALLSTLILVGCLYRLSTILFFLGFTYIFLLEQARYLNHFYFVCLVSLSMILIPAHRTFSVDAQWRPKLRSETAPTWSLWLLRAQMAIVYFYGGLAKLNGDWLRGEPMRMWLAGRTDYPVLGPYFDKEWMIYLFSYGGLLFDLLTAPLLLWRKTRPYAFCLVVVFHLTNNWLFQIGIFPWFSIGMSALFFSPDWPRRLFSSLGLARRQQAQKVEIVTTNRGQFQQYATLGFLGTFMAFQLLMPLRHWLYPGNVSWTEEGHNFSWHMKLRSKSARVLFTVTDTKTKESWTIRPRKYLKRWQERKMSTRPDMILQFSRFLAEQMQKEGHGQVEVRARVMASLNGRRPRLLIDPTIDLAAQRPSLWPAPWILPLDEPLTPQVASEDP